MEAKIKFSLHLNNGRSLAVYIPQEADADPLLVDEEAIGEALINEMNENRPGWYRLGSTIFHSSAVAAIDVDAYGA